MSLKFLFPLGALIMLTIILDRKVFIIPPLGPLLSPFVGVVQNERVSEDDKSLSLKVNQETEIVFDQRAVPHIFANNPEDMFFAQGYVCASDRLWQMDFLSYVAAGRLSEIFGSEFIIHDRIRRRDGMLSSAKAALDVIEKDQETKRALDNYTAGVNTLIKSLSPADLPIEYKLMDYLPEPWTNLKSVLVMKYMSYNLSGYEEDVSASYLRMVLGSKEYDKLFPNYYLEHSEKGFGIERVLDDLPSNEYIDYSFLESSPYVKSSDFNPRLGSNSWAVSPRKSKSGNAILCSDPHLDLSFPSIWYELQLKSNDQNVYGFSIPGVPGIVVGFNENISWGLTNGSNDVRDYYKLELKDEFAYYKYDGKWIETDLIIEEIKVRDDDSILDTVFYSVHGPIPSDFRVGPRQIKGCALSWTLHDASNEILTFIQLNKAKNYSEFKRAITHFQCPVQNFSYADVNGNIAMHHQGKVRAKRWKNQGKFILDGTRSDQYTTSAVDIQLPYSFNPNQGFVFSANNNPYALNDSILSYGYFTELRANKIESYLLSKDQLSIDDMKSMQLDNTSRLAELAIPIILRQNLSVDKTYLERFSDWDYRYDKESELAPVFEGWWSNITDNTWDELTRFTNVYTLPADLVLLDLIENDPNSKYFDLLSTEKIESASDIIDLSFNQIWNDTTELSSWGSMNQIDINHLSNIEDLSRKGTSMGGNPNALNALNGNWGPSLRMIVEMSERPKGYAVYAGGQSGNPASNEYDRFVDSWENGQYYELNFFRDTDEGNREARYKWSLK